MFVWVCVLSACQQQQQRLNAHQRLPLRSTYSFFSQKFHASYIAIRLFHWMSHVQMYCMCPMAERKRIQSRNTIQRDVSLHYILQLYVKWMNENKKYSGVDDSSEYFCFFQFLWYSAHTLCHFGFTISADIEKKSECAISLNLLASHNAKSAYNKTVYYAWFHFLKLWFLVVCGVQVIRRGREKKMSSDGGDGDDTVHGYLPGSIEPYVSSRNVQSI